jgi:two-component system sensor histidine kinase/response regulator
VPSTGGSPERPSGAFLFRGKLGSFEEAEGEVRWSDEKAECLQRQVYPEDRERFANLKTPLNAIITLPQVILMDANLDTEQRENLQLICESGQRMLDEINLSLKLYKIETGGYESEVETVDTVQIVRQVQKDLASLLRARGLDLLFLLNGTPAAADAALPVNGERLLLQMMLSNLIKNAAEASPHGERITVKIGLATAGMRLEIHNLGAVPEEIRSCFFDKYVSRGKRGGTGLGTYTARLVTQAHGGTIDFVSSTDAGTTVSVTLPQTALATPRIVGAA